MCYSPTLKMLSTATGNRHKVCPLYQQAWSASGPDILFGHHPKDYGARTPSEWFHANHGRFILPAAEIYAARIPFDDPECYADGVYFLFLDVALQYVGQSIRVSDRLVDHRYKDPKPFTHYAALWAPSDILDPVESYYIHTMRPPLNRRDWAPHRHAMKYIKRATADIAARLD